MQTHYSDKFDRISHQTRFAALDEASRESLRHIAFEHRFTLQELRIVVEATLEMRMWGEENPLDYWRSLRWSGTLAGRDVKKRALRELADRRQALLDEEIVYPADPVQHTSLHQVRVRAETRPAGEKLIGLCPVASEKTVCCNLHTLDAVKNCGFGCSYCGIQTMFDDKDVVFDRDFGRKLEALELDPQRRWHVGTGQSSDALMWGNHNCLLDDLLRFARNRPHVLLELKTKSRNVGHLRKAQVPPNVICTWSLNPETVIRNEEHRTAPLAQRLAAARAVADTGIRVGFHLHPMIHYRGWREAYAELIAKIQEMFDPDEVVLISFGSLTFPKPVLNRLRAAGIRSRISQTPLVDNPEGKLTYPDGIKLELFSHAWQCFTPWHNQVFFYLCMEEAKFWQSTLGRVYGSNDEFEQDLLECVFAKLPAANTSV